VDIYEKIEDFYNTVTATKTVIGKSVFGRKIFAVKIGDGEPVGIAQYAMHGREFITARLALEQYKIGLKSGSCWLIPLVNPDGCLLSERGLESVENKREKERLLALNQGNTDFSLWKANGRGVDLNVNFAANWGQGAKNVKKAGAENYIGKKPFSEPETQALKLFTQKLRPDYTVSYHTKGEEIYWYFHQPIGRCAKDKVLAEVLSSVTGYKLAYAKNSVGGYKDWCIKTLQIPAFTIEAGADEFEHPLGTAAWENVLEHNRRALFCLSGAVKERMC